MARNLWRDLLRGALDALIDGANRKANRKGSQPRRSAGRGADPVGLLGSPGRSGPDATVDVAPSDVALIRISYAPDPDGDPDPGEVVWTWVPYAENDGRGKDRPVLVIGRINAETVAGCYLSTKQHRGFVSVGTGGWDSQGRESFLSPERLLRITAAGMRREGYVLPRDRFERAVAVVAAEYGLRA